MLTGLSGLSGLSGVAAGPTPAAPAEPGVLVSGAGTAEANAEYLPTGTLNGRTYYIKEGQPDDPDASSVLWLTNRWDIILSDGSVGYRNNNEDVPNPWDSAAWAAVEGTEPAPTVTEA